MTWVFVNGGFHPEARAVLGTGDLALQRGYAAFDYFRTRNNRPLFLEDYLDRIERSAASMFITLPLRRAQMREAIAELMQKNAIPESGVRMVATGGYAPDSYTPGTGNFVIQQQALRLPSPEQFVKGVKIATHEYVRDLPQVKSINYLMGIWLNQQLKQKALSDVLYHRDGLVSEFPRANVFIVTKKGELVTPGNDILLGITRMKLLELAQDMVPVQVRDVALSEVMDAAAVFMTSTTKRILPVVEIDGKTIGAGRAGPVTTQLNEAFLSLESRLCDQ